MEYEFQLSHVAAIIAIVAASAGLCKYFITDYMGLKSRRAKEEEAKNTFDSIVKNLSSSDNTTKLSAAIMLRRFFKISPKEELSVLKTESINVISAILKVVPTGVFQKTLADGLVYAVDL